MKKKMTIQQIAYVALGAALIAICSWISIPLTIPITLQTFAVCLVAALFGARLGLWTVGSFILLGAVGLPVFSGFKGGFGVLLGTTGGYIIGFLFTALIVGLAADRLGRRLWVLILSMIVGIGVCYAFGTAWFVIIYTHSKGAVTVMSALSWCVIPYLVPDAVKIALATVLANRLYPFVKVRSENDKSKGPRGAARTQ